MTARDRLRNEQGGVMVFVALLLPLIVLFLVFVIDVGNWWTHDRHLQLQADAAALAAASSVTYPCDSSAAEAEGRNYGGELYNAQVGGANRGAITLRFNSTTYASGTPPAPDDTPAGDICSTGIVDVKATESDLPLFFGSVVPGFSVVPAINAHARAELRKPETFKGLLPLAIPDTNFRYLFAQFVVAGTTTPVPGCANDCTVELLHTADASGMTIWTTAAPVALPVASSQISLRLGVVYAKTKTLSCTAAGVSCFSNVNFVRGYRTSNPAFHDVRMLPGTCGPDGYFASVGGGCSPGVRAVLDLGSNAQSGNGITTKVWANIAGDSKDHQLTPENPDPGTGEQTWILENGLPLDSVGAHGVTVSWSWTKTSGGSCTKKNPCTSNGSEVAQSSYLSDASTPFELVQLSHGGVSGANSFTIGSTPSLDVTAGVVDNVEAAASSSDPTVLLRFSSGSGSGNQAVDCDPNTTLRDEIETGCETPYQVNVTETCPNGDDPASCVSTQTGDARGQITQGMDARFAQCPVNNWRKGDPEFAPSDIKLSDPRLVPLIIVPWASFDESGTQLLPVLEFAYFYVTGWDGDGSCPEPATGNEAYPGTGSPHGDVWGHFYAYRGALEDVTPGEELCDLKSSDPGICLPVLTR